MIKYYHHVICPAPANTSFMRLTMELSIVAKKFVKLLVVLGGLLGERGASTPKPLLWVPFIFSTAWPG
jgi:hypothetical protein